MVKLVRGNKTNHNGGRIWTQRIMNLARQQQERRKRVSRIKTGIIMTIAIWIAISILAIVVLGIMVVKLNSRIYKLELQLNTAISSTVTGTESDDGDIASDEESSGAKNSGCRETA